jgi:hypothetical protein
MCTGSVPGASGWGKLHGQQSHPAPGQHVDDGELLGERHRVMMRQQQDAGAENDPLGRRRDEAQARQRIGDGGGRRDRDGPHHRADVQRDVLGDIEGLEPAGFAMTGDADHLVRVRAEKTGVLTRSLV